MSWCTTVSCIKTVANSTALRITVKWRNTQTYDKRCNQLELRLPNLHHGLPKAYFCEDKDDCIESHLQKYDDYLFQQHEQGLLAAADNIKES